jgi:CubicO group peptidase (beta-lactamase class C family)
MRMTTSSLPRSTPEAQGVDSRAVHALVSALHEQDLGLHSIMVLRHGSVIAEGWWGPYSAAQRQMMFSVSKSFMATAVGIAEDEGLLSVDDDILSFFPSYATPAIRANVAGLKVRHLLAMATGHTVATMSVMNALPTEDWVRLFLEMPIVYPPGTHFLYNSGASYMLSAIVTARAGQSLLEYLTPRLFEPLGIETPPWQSAPSGITLGWVGLRVRTEDVAKLGQLYLQRGVWQGRRLLSEDWVDRASSAQVANDTNSPVDWSQGYGYQFWRSRHNSYRADGAFGQFSLVLPDLDLVVAITEGAREPQRTLDAVWDLLLPGVHDEALPENPAEVDALRGRLATLEVPAPSFSAVDPQLAHAVAGRRIELSFNTLGIEAVSLDFGEQSVRLTATSRAGWSETVPAGRTEWLTGNTRFWDEDELPEVATASRAGWVDECTFEFHEQCLDTPFRRIWRFAFNPRGNDVSVAIGLEPEYWGAYNEVLTGTWS